MANELPYSFMSLVDFCRRAKGILNVDDYAGFVKFVLTGIHGAHQAVVDPIMHKLDEDEGLSVARDYDSLLGIHPDIRVHGHLTIYPLAKREDTLTTSIHLKHTFDSSRGPFTAPIHKVPNLCLAKWDMHNVIRVFIPELYSEERSSFLTQNEQRTFYECGLLPVVQRLEPDRTSDWPVTYDDEMFRARGRNGQLSMQTKVTMDWMTEYLGDYIRDALASNGLTWGIGLVFLHQIRGVKNSTAHSMTSHAAQNSLVTFLKEIRFLRPDVDNYDELLASGTWWLDVAIEVTSAKKRCLAWRTDSHFSVVQRVTGIAAHHADRITQIGSGQYTRDMSIHLPAVSGCRITPGSRGQGGFDVHYLQLYTTDKSLIYRLDQGHHGKFINCVDILAGKGVEYAQRLYNLYRNASKETPSQARLEVRVPLSHASRVLLNIDSGLLYNSLLSFASACWWGLRAYRCQAIQLILEWQQVGAPHLRASREALLLTAACQWILNGLHSTPDTGPSSRELMDAVLPHIERVGADPDILAYRRSTEDDDSDDIPSEDSTDSEDEPPPRKRRRTSDTVSALPYGLLFLRTLRVGSKYPVPRLNYAPEARLSPRSFKYFFGIEADEIEADFFRKKLVQRPNPNRVPNKVRRTQKYVPPENEDRIDFAVSKRGVQLLEPARDPGSDLEDSSDGRDVMPMDDEAPNIDTVLTHLWRQFLLDLTAKAPNQRGSSNPSYCKLGIEERRLVNDSTYQNQRLSDYFLDCQWKIPSQKEWLMVFNRFWPSKCDAITAQNYRQTNYFPNWIKRLEDLDENDIPLVRQALKAKFDQLYWVPFAQTDRIWGTKFMQGFEKSSGIDRAKAAPQIFLNPLAKPPCW